MEMQQRNLDNPSKALSVDASPMRWIAPLQSIEIFSIAEFTQSSLSPGNDGSGINTAS
ncbi:hypothetical protein [Elstera cyanobacteriorum]|uniref:hypothetical protein n=1 Tax=Elstera cyanobacteriorum TaxID=2022747 RepID=UPI001481E9AD|nr:hypothetical protein [Elstera cyanobacteriorum]